MFPFRRKPKPYSPPEPAERPALIALLDSLSSFNTAALADALAAMEPLRIAPKFELALKDGVLEGSVSFDSHVVRIAGFDVPAPESALGRTLDIGGLKPEMREGMHNHKAHLLLFHEAGGPSPVERVFALYKLAAVMGADALLGVAFEQAWACVPASMVLDMRKPGQMEYYRKLVPLVMFCGFVPVRSDDGDWYVTRGGHLYGVPDFVMSAQGEKAMDALLVFHNVFLYVLQDRMVAAGHTMQFGEEVFLRFEGLPEGCPPELHGKGVTLLIKRISRDEIKGKA